MADVGNNKKRGPKQHHVLIAAGDDGTASQLAALLRGEGFEVFISVGNGGEALRMARANHVDLAFVDLAMKGDPDGPGIAKHLGLDRRVAVIGIIHEPFAPETDDFKPYAYLSTPFDIQSLRLALNSAKGRCSAERALVRSEDLHKRYRTHQKAVLARKTAELKKMNSQLHRLLYYIELTDRKLASDSLVMDIRNPPDMVPDIEEGIITVDPRLHVVLINAAAAQMLGRSEDEIANLPISDVIVPTDPSTRTTLAESMKTMIAEGSPGENFENLKILLASGESRILSAYCEPIFDSDDTIAGLVFSFRYAAESRKKEYETIRIQRLESLCLMVRGFGHDLNNMLSSVLANIQLARVDLPPKNPVLKKLDNAEESVMRARELSRQLLLSSTRKEPPTKVRSLPALIRKTGAFSTRGSVSRAEYSLSEDLWDVSAEGDIIRLILADLFLFLASGQNDGGVIRVSAKNLPAGEGEPEGEFQEDRVKIRLHAPALKIRPDEKTGLFASGKAPAYMVDLSFAESLAQKTGGSLLVESGGKGIAFELYLPALIGSHTAKRKSDVHIQRVPALAKKILLMDDEEAILSATSEMLKFLGYEVTTAQNGNIATEIYKKAFVGGKPFDAVILDITVPDGAGAKETLPLLVAIDPAVKAIVSSGYSTNPMITGFRSFGFAGAIVKPYGFRELQEALGKALPQVQDG